MRDVEIYRIQYPRFITRSKAINLQSSRKHKETISLTTKVNFYENFPITVTYRWLE